MTEAQARALKVGDIVVWHDNPKDYGKVINKGYAAFAIHWKDGAVFHDQLPGRSAASIINQTKKGIPIMKKEELTVGATYIVKHSSGAIPARLDVIREIDGYALGARHYRAKTEYRCTNIKTGRVIIFRSPQKFIRLERLAKAVPYELSE